MKRYIRSKETSQIDLQSSCKEMLKQLKAKIKVDYLDNFSADVNWRIRSSLSLDPPVFINIRMNPKDNWWPYPSTDNEHCFLEFGAYLNQNTGDLIGFWVQVLDHDMHFIGQMIPSADSIPTQINLSCEELNRLPDYSSDVVKEMYELYNKCNAVEVKS